MEKFVYEYHNILRQDVLLCAKKQEKEIKKSKKKFLEGKRVSPFSLQISARSVFVIKERKKERKKEKNRERKKEIEKERKKDKKAKETTRKQ